ncbi:MAG TPA: type II secretion system protein [Patescibacteria group bacterium]|nr:type II secretion system protein [Patescibacteria group bacterium]
MGIKKSTALAGHHLKFVDSTSGLTLIEVLIVTAIIILMLILSFTVFRKQLAKGNDAKRKSDIYHIKQAVEEYEKDHDCYPVSPLPACEPGEGLQPYLDKIPCDPVTKDDYIYYPDPDHNICPQWYWIFSTLDYKYDPQIDDLGCLLGCGPSQDELNYNYYQTSPNAPEPYKGEGTPTEPPSPTPVQKYGCFNRICLPILTSPICHPNYIPSDCNNECAGGANECEDI